MSAEPSQLSQKLFFRIGEAAEVLDVEPHVLRYWETEFPIAKPNKSRTGQRLYRREDLEVFIKIRELLYRDKFTIDGARRRLREWLKSPERQKTKNQHSGDQTKSEVTADADGGEIVQAVIAEMREWVDSEDF